jgi:hypothetical protein
MSLLTGFAINTAHAEGSRDQDTIVLSDRDDQLILDRAERETIEQR